jgi:hypothetical protein
MNTALVFDPASIRKYDKAGPRYTSYPTAVQFHAGFGEAEYREQAAASNASGRPLSLYLHIPFCDTVCFYCACNKIITKNRRHTISYLTTCTGRSRCRARCSSRSHAPAWECRRSRSSGKSPRVRLKTLERLDLLPRRSVGAR